MNALAKLDKFFFAEFGNSLLTGKNAAVVVFRPEDEQNPSSLFDTPIIENTKQRCMRGVNLRSFKNPGTGKREV